MPQSEQLGLQISKVDSYSSGSSIADEKAGPNGKAPLDYAEMPVDEMPLPQKKSGPWLTVAPMPRCSPQVMKPPVGDSEIPKSIQAAEFNEVIAINKELSVRRKNTTLYSRLKTDINTV